MEMLVFKTEKLPIFALKAVAAANKAVSVELPEAAWSRRHPRDGFDSLPMNKLTN